MLRRFASAVIGLGRRLWPLWVLLGLAAVGAAVGAPHLLAWHHLAAGRTAVEQFHADEARPHLDACLAVWPDCVEARLLAARAARLAGDFDAAENHLRACQRLQKTPSEDTVLEWAMFRVAGGDLDGDAEDHMRDIIRTDPAHAAPEREALAEGYTRMYRVLDALNVLQQWLDVEPDAVQALALRGDLYWQIGAMGKAADEYRRVVEREPQRRQARERLAVGLIESGRFEEALKQLAVVRQGKPDDPETETLVARCDEWLDRKEEARKTLDPVLAKHPDFGPALRQRGHVLLQDGRAAEAEDWLRRAVEAMPDDYQANWALYQALEQEGKADEARAQRERAEAIKDLIARLEEVTTRQMSARPRDPALYTELGEIFLKKGRKDLGERWLRSALGLDPHYGPAHAALARFYQEQGDEEQAALHRREAQAP